MTERLSDLWGESGHRMPVGATGQPDGAGEWLAEALAGTDPAILGTLGLAAVILVGVGLALVLQRSAEAAQHRAPPPENGDARVSGDDLRRLRHARQHGH